MKSRLQVRGIVHRKSGLNFVNLQILIRLPSPFHLQMVQPMKLQILPWSGFGARHQGWRSVSPLHNSQFFADGEPRVKPLLIFRGKGKRIGLQEQLQYDRRVSVQFQSNAWCDEVIMEWWAKNSWKPHVKEESLLVLDLHKAQKTDQN